MASGGVAKELTSKEAEIQKMLTAEVHLGTKNCIYIINLGKTWDKLQMAARVIVAIEKPQDIIVESARPYGQRAVLKFAHEPRLLILTDPRTDHQPIKEAALGNILTIAFCDTDSPMRYVDIGIPILARMVLQMRGVINQGPKWEVMVDLFFYREPEEAKEEEEEAALADYADYSAPALGGTDHWSSQFPDAQWKNEGVQAAIPDVPGATGWTADAVLMFTTLVYISWNVRFLICLVGWFIFALPARCSDVLLSLTNFRDIVA
ncbi:hypothetical protein DCAR_0205594 [Daucus carota subsp. sativus]|uniref:40S ribosomal protein SA n=1 Tax=Daucus carota subsp. sativus TaxID=79200 RepID=A0AAF0WBI9_DAUCS|nr:hypothetical protein DCAR_0205594 [Daucus carota subsp. sativus]